MAGEFTTAAGAINRETGREFEKLAGRIPSQLFCWLQRRSNLLSRLQIRIVVVVSASEIIKIRGQIGILHGQSPCSCSLKVRAGSDSPIPWGVEKQHDCEETRSQSTGGDKSPQTEPISNSIARFGLSVAQNAHYVPREKG